VSQADLVTHLPYLQLLVDPKEILEDPMVLVSLEQAVVEQELQLVHTFLVVEQV
tara:strand:+ start:299 stop:460 length:162 start_codon:yes stop_codon:yes gene_type:complete